MEIIIDPRHSQLIAHDRLLVIFNKIMSISAELDGLNDEYLKAESEFNYFEKIRIQKLANAKLKEVDKLQAESSYLENALTFGFDIAYN